MSAQPKEKENESHEMTLRPKTKALVWPLSAAVLVFVIASFVAQHLYLAGLFTRFSLFAYSCMVLAAVGSAISFIYILRVVLSSRSELKFEQGGIIDQLSPFRLGPISRHDVRKVKVTSHIMFGTSLAVFLNPDGPALKRMGFIKGTLFFLYSLIFDRTIYFPLKWMGVTKHDLESRLMFLRQKVVTEDTSTMTRAQRFAREAEIEKDGYEPTVSEYQEVEITRPDYEKYETAPPVSAIEKDELFEKVEKIKQHVAQTHLDTMLCELFTDEISLWLEWEGHRDWPKPKELKDIRLVDNTINYQEISFTYHDKSFHFGLRRNVGSSQEALLSVSYQGQLRIALKVQVEIGSLTPKKLEQYTQGDWEIELRALSDGIADLRGRRRSGLDEDEPITRTDVEIENTAELKRRFGV